MGLLPGCLSPALAEVAVLLGSALPFAQAARLLTQLTGTGISTATMQRLTETAGMAWQQLELDVGDALATAALMPGVPDVAVPDAVSISPGTVLQISVDGAMVPLVGGEWTEARTAAIGYVAPTGTTALSYVSAVADATTFTHFALAELTRRGVPDAPTVVAVTDGAPWIQGFLDVHCPQAIRVLDFAHAAGYLAQAAQAAFGPGTAATSDWFGQQRHELRHGDPDQVLTMLAALPPSVERATALGYLRPRRAMLAYAAFAARGLPIGSGCVESANKVVIEVRLKGAGMHWTRVHADAMVGLRTLVASDRWSAGWARIVRALQAAQPTRARHRRQQRSAAVHPGRPPDMAPPPPTPVSPPPSVRPVVAPRPKLVVNGKPTPDHPWKRGRVCAPPAFTKF